MAAAGEEPVTQQNPADAALISDVAQHCLSEGASQQWREFMEEHEATFADEGEEHKLEYTDIHNRFVEMIESSLDAFLAERGSTPDAFFAICAESVRGGNSDAAVFAELITACSDFLPFVDIMRDRAKRDYFFTILRGWRSTLK